MNKKQKSKETSAVKRYEISQVVNNVLKATKNEIQQNVTSDWRQYLEITTNLDLLRRLQPQLKSDGPTRDLALGAFNKWCKAGGAIFPNVEVKKISANYEMGLVAKVDLLCDEVFIQIPENLIFAWKRVENKLPAALRACPLFDEKTSHVRLAFALCVERILPAQESEWKPYLDILPSAYRACMYWTTSEMEELKGESKLKS